jgi:hypothetical protein
LRERRCARLRIFYGVYCRAQHRYLAEFLSPSVRAQREGSRLPAPA